MTRMGIVGTEAVVLQQLFFNSRSSAVALQQALFNSVSSAVVAQQTALRKGVSQGRGECLSLPHTRQAQSWRPQAASQRHVVRSCLRPPPLFTCVCGVCCVVCLRGRSRPSSHLNITPQAPQKRLHLLDSLRSRIVPSRELVPVRELVRSVLEEDGFDGVIGTRGGGSWGWGGDCRVLHGGGVLVVEGGGRVGRGGRAGDAAYRGGGVVFGGHLTG